MNSSSRRRMIVAGLAAASLAVGSIAADRAPPEAELIHASEPLWRPGPENVWPQHFADESGFGCTHRIKLGDWRYKPSGDEGSESWFRFTNYGVFHCWMNVAEAREPDDFDGSRPGFLIQLDSSDHSGPELWALQIGARPGSDYLLLARKPGKGLIDRFDVLQRQCPRDSVRGGQSLDILLARYCAIETRADLISLSRRMAKLPSLGTLAFEREPIDRQ